MSSEEVNLTFSVLKAVVKLYYPDLLKTKLVI